jgi:hypothetical protein
MMLLIRSIADRCSASLSFCHTAALGSDDSAGMSFFLIFSPPYSNLAHIIQPEAKEDEAESILIPENQPVCVSEVDPALGTKHLLFGIQSFPLMKRPSMHSVSAQTFHQEV